MREEIRSIPKLALSFGAAHCGEVEKERERERERRERDTLAARGRLPVRAHAKRVRVCVSVERIWVIKTRVFFPS